MMDFRTATICSLLLTSLTLWGCAHTVRSTNWSESIYAHADALALGADIAPLRAGGEPEVRIWADNVMFGEVVGRVTTTDRVAEHTLNWRIDDSGAMTFAHRGYRDLPTSAQPAVLSEALSQLRSLDGQNWECAVDGVSILVDGVVDGRRFAFAVSNPDFCDDERSRLAVQGISPVAPSNWQPLRR